MIDSIIQDIKSRIMELRFEQRLANRLRTLRKAAGMTLDELATRSGVSRSMISLAERAESSPTANSLDRLAAALGVSMASLFAEPERGETSPVIRKREQAVWQDPASGYVRRVLTPPGNPTGVALTEITLPPGTEVALDNPTRSARVDQQIWILSGAVEVGVGEVLHRLEVGDCLAMDLDQPSSFRNPGRRPARYLVATSSEQPGPSTSRIRATAQIGNAVQGASNNEF